MQCTQEATLAINDYVDRVRLALPLSPSAQLAAADRLYREIIQGCESKARAAGQIVVDLTIARDQLTALGSTEECAHRLAADQSSWQWPGDVFGDAFRERRFHNKVETFTKVAAERGQGVARASMDAAAYALGVASQKLREAAEKLKTKD